MKTKYFWKKTGIWALVMMLMGSSLTAQVLADSEEDDDPVPSITITVQAQIKGEYPAEDQPHVVYELELQSKEPQTNARFDDYPVATYEELAEEANQEQETLAELLDESRPRSLIIHGEGEDSFDTLYFTEPGTYVYTIDQMEIDHDNYTGDDTIYTLTVVVYARSRNSLDCYATLKDEEGKKQDIATFILEYEEPEPEPTPEPTDEPTPTPTNTDEPEPTPTDTDEPTPTPTDTDEPTPTPTDTDEPTPTPTTTDEPEPTPVTTDEPEETPQPTATPVPTTKGNNPKTGDTTNIAAPLSLLVVTALALVAVVLRKKENYK